jgi:hypothetical protein
VSERRAWVAWAAIVVVTLAVGAADLAHTRTAISPIPPSCSSDAGSCNDVRNREVFARQDRVRQLDHDFDRRAWIYAVIAAAALVAVTIAAASTQASVEKGRSLFASAGVAGVVVALFGVVVLLQPSYREIRPPLQAVFLPAVILLVLAAIGGSVTRFATAVPTDSAAAVPDDQGDSSTRAGGRVIVAALACTALTVVLAQVFATHQPGGCDSLPDAPTWTGAVAWAAIAIAVVAGILALWALAYKRWFVALVCFVVNPAALIWMLLSTGVLC